MPDLNQINLRLNQIQSGDIGWINRTQAQANKLLAKEYLTAYKAVDAEIVLLYKRHGDLTYAEMAKYDRLTKLQLEIHKHLRRVNGNVRMIIYQDLRNEFSEAYYRTGYGFESATGSGLGFTSIEPGTINAALAKQYDFRTIIPTLQKNTLAINSSVNHSITQGLLQGFGYGKMTRGIKENFNRGYNDAVRITRTEGHRAREIGRLEGIERVEKKGVKVRRYWISAFAANTRQEHASMDGEYTDKQNIFHLPGGISTEAPGITGVAYWDINCLCHVGTKVVGFRPEYKRVKGKIVKRNIAYKEWKKERNIK